MTEFDDNILEFCNLNSDMFDTYNDYSDMIKLMIHWKQKLLIQIDQITGGIDYYHYVRLSIYE